MLKINKEQTIIDEKGIEWILEKGDEIKVLREGLGNYFFVDARGNPVSIDEAIDEFGKDLLPFLDKEKTALDQRMIKKNLYNSLDEAYADASFELDWYGYYKPIDDDLTVRNYNIYLTDGKNYYYFCYLSGLDGFLAEGEEMGNLFLFQGDVWSSFKDVEDHIKKQYKFNYNLNEYKNEYDVLDEIKISKPNEFIIYDEEGYLSFEKINWNRGLYVDYESQNPPIYKKDIENYIFSS